MKPVPEFQRAHDLGLRRLSHKSIHWGRELPRDRDFGVYFGEIHIRLSVQFPFFSISTPKNARKVVSTLVTGCFLFLYFVSMGIPGS